MSTRMTSEQLQRVSCPPQVCPRCGRKNAPWGWRVYRLIPGAPAVGCGACGYVVYLAVKIAEPVAAEQPETGAPADGSLW